MSQANPYTPGDSIPPGDVGIRKVNVKPFRLFQRASRLIGDQYWLFVGITLLAMLIGSAVPLGLIMGPVLVGIFCCFVEREEKGRVDLQTMFKGFENFLEPFLAFLIFLAATIAVMVPIMIVMFAVLFVPIIQAAHAAGPGNPPGPMPTVFIVTLLAMYPVMIITNMCVTLPFVFTFQLIADRDIKAIDAIRLSAQGALRNFWGVLWCLIVVTFVSVLAALMCYVPLFLLLPITSGAFYVLYRDIYGPPPPRAAAPTVEVIDADVVDADIVE